MYNYEYSFSTFSTYFLRTKCLLTFMVGPISPPGIEKSVGRIVHFCILCALEVALLLYRSMPACMASIMTVSGFLRTSSKVSDFDPCSLHQSIVSCANLDLGSNVSLSIWKVRRSLYVKHFFYQNGQTSAFSVTRHERNFLLSPMRTTLERQGSSFFTWIAC